VFMTVEYERRFYSDIKFRCLMSGRIIEVIG